MYSFCFIWRFEEIPGIFQNNLDLGWSLLFSFFLTGCRSAGPGLSGRKYLSLSQPPTYSKTVRFVPSFQLWNGRSESREPLALKCHEIFNSYVTAYLNGSQPNSKRNSHNVAVRFNYWQGILFACYYIRFACPGENRTKSKKTYYYRVIKAIQIKLFYAICLNRPVLK